MKKTVLLAAFAGALALAGCNARRPPKPRRRRRR